MRQDVSTRQPKTPSAIDALHRVDAHPAKLAACARSGVLACFAAPPEASNWMPLVVGDAVLRPCADHMLLAAVCSELGFPACRQLDVATSIAPIQIT